jgi:hypothetical protein
MLTLKDTPGEYVFAGDCDDPYDGTPIPVEIQVSKRDLANMILKAQRNVGGRCKSGPVRVKIGQAKSK